MSNTNYRIISGKIVRVKFGRFNTESEYLSISMVSEDEKETGTFFWATSSTDGRYYFGRNVLMDLLPDASKHLMQDQTVARAWLASDLSTEILQTLVGQSIEITIQRGNANPKGGRYPDEWVPSRLQPLSFETALRILRETQSDLGDIPPF